MTILKKSYNDLLAEIEALKAERDAYKQAYEQAMLAGSDDTTADSFNEYYLAQQSENVGALEELAQAKAKADALFGYTDDEIIKQGLADIMHGTYPEKDDSTIGRLHDYFAQASDDAHDTPAFVSSDALEELKAELTDITEPIPCLDDDGEVA